MENKIKFLIISLLGIMILIFITAKTEAPKTNIENITEKNLGQNIRVEAKITNIREFPEKRFQILTLKDETSQIIAISNSKTSLNVNKNFTYIIIGKIQEYNKTLQINIDRIEIK